MADKRAFIGEIDPEAGAQLWFVDASGVRHPVEHVVDQSPNGLSWGYSGPGPADTALSILTRAADAATAERLAEPFMREVVARFGVNEGFTLPWAQLEAWVLAQGERLPGRERPATADATNDGANPDPEQWSRSLAARSRALDQRARRLAEAEARVDAMATLVGLVPNVPPPAISLPAEPVRRQLDALVVDTGDDIAQLARARGIDADWAAAVVARQVAEVDLAHIAQVCEGLSCTPYDLWGPSGARSISPAYGPAQWPAHTEALPALDGEDVAPLAPSADWARAGQVRLWRVEPATLAAVPDVPAWLVAQAGVGDRLAMQGRWFTANEPDVDVYASEIFATGAEPRTYYVDLPVAEAARYRVDADRVARRLARSPAHEYLLPAGLAADKVPLLGDAATIDATLEPLAPALDFEAPAPVLERDLGLDLEMAP